jgi:phospholipid/cholesterol/gamma-HCH transport system substrate-binding protein
MVTRAQKLKLGVFAIATAVLVVLVIVVFAGVRFWESRDRYYVVTDDSVMGLEVGAHVYYLGVRVGSVDGIQLADNGRVRIAIDVRDDAPIRSDTVAQIRMAGITGLKVIDLQAGTAEPLQSGSEIAVGATALDKIEQQADEMLDRTNQILDRTSVVVERAGQAMANVVAITEPAQYDSIADFLDHARDTAATLSRTSATLERMVTDNRVVLRTALESVDRAAKSGATAADQLAGVVRENQLQMRSSMQDIRQASRSFKELARELRERPSRILFSKPPQERRLP